MVDFTQIKSAPVGNESAFLSLFRGADGAAAVSVVAEHPDVYFKLAVVALPSDLKMVCQDVGVSVLAETGRTIEGPLCHIVARTHEVHRLVDAFAEQGQILAPFYITPLQAFVMGEQGLKAAHLSVLPKRNASLSIAPEGESLLAVTAFEKALMQSAPLAAFVFEAASSVVDAATLAPRVDEILAVQSGVLHQPQLPAQGVCFIAAPHAAEKIARLPDVTVQLVRPLQAFSAHYEAGGEILSFPYVGGRPQFVSVPVSNGRISVPKLSQGAH